MQTNNAQCLNMQNAKNWESRDTAYLVRWRPRLFQSSTVCKSPLVLNAKDDLRADGQSFCFLASGIQRETPFSFLLSPFSVSVSSLSFGFLHLLLLFLQTESQSLLLPCFSSLFFVFSFLFFLFYCLPSWSHSNARMKEETPSVLCLFFSPNCLPLLRFLSFFFCFSLFSPFFFCLASLLFFPFVFPFLSH